MQTKSIEFSSKKPAQSIIDFVDSFWELTNHSEKDHKIIILPDGRIDIIFLLADNNSVVAYLKGLDIEPKQAIIPANTTMFAVSFKLLVIQYLLKQRVDSLHNELYQCKDCLKAVKQLYRKFDSFQN